MSQPLHPSPVARAVALSLAVIGGAASAQDAAPLPAPQIPSAAEVKRVYDYLERGKEQGPILLDLIPCTKIDQAKGSPTQFQCLEPVQGPVKKGTVVNAWLQFLCPKDGKYEDLAVQYLHEGQVRQTADVVVGTSGRTRTWKAAALSKTGAWTIKLLRGDKELGSVTVTAE